MDTVIRNGAPLALGFQIDLEKSDFEKREVWGWASTETPDKHGDVIDYEGAKSAFAAWHASGGNVREQHDRHRVIGKSVAWKPDDERRGIYLGVYLSKSDDGERALTKVREGVLGGFSIAGIATDASPEIVKAGGAGSTVNRIRKFELAEVSLVDRPANPEARITLVKSVDGALAGTSVLASAEDLGEGGFGEEGAVSGAQGAPASAESDTITKAVDAAVSRSFNSLLDALKANGFVKAEPSDAATVNNPPGYKLPAMSEGQEKTPTDRRPASGDSEQQPQTGNDAKKRSAKAKKGEDEVIEDGVDEEHQKKATSDGGSNCVDGVADSTGPKGGQAVGPLGSKDGAAEVQTTTPPAALNTLRKDRDGDDDDDYDADHSELIAHEHSHDKEHGGASHSHEHRHKDEDGSHDTTYHMRFGPHKDDDDDDNDEDDNDGDEKKLEKRIDALVSAAIEKALDPFLPALAKLEKVDVAGFSKAAGYTPGALIEKVVTSSIEKALTGVQGQLTEVAAGLETFEQRLQTVEATPAATKAAVRGVIEKSLDGIQTEHHQLEKLDARAAIEKVIDTTSDPYVKERLGRELAMHLMTDVMR